MTKSNIIGIHGGHAEIGSRGAKGYLDEVNVNRKLVKYIKEYLKKHGYVVKDCSVKSGTQIAHENLYLHVEILTLYSV